MQRGFKTDAERMGTEVRAELNLGCTDALRPLDLAEHLAVPVFSLSHVLRHGGKNSALSYFASIDTDSFSAVTIFRGTRRIIVHNDTHHPNRQASNLAHELSHCLLGHDPAELIGEDGQRYWNSELEEEAHWLGGTLLVPRAGALVLLKAGSTIEEMAVKFGVSLSLCRWRINTTGVAAQLTRAARFSSR